MEWKYLYSFFACFGHDVGPVLVGVLYFVTTVVCEVSKISLLAMAKSNLLHRQLARKEKLRGVSANSQRSHFGLRMAEQLCGVG